MPCHWLTLACAFASAQAQQATNAQADGLIVVSNSAPVVRMPGDASVRSNVSAAMVDQYDGSMLAAAAGVAAVHGRLFMDNVEGCECVARGQCCFCFFVVCVVVVCGPYLSLKHSRRCCAVCEPCVWWLCLAPRSLCRFDGESTFPVLPKPATKMEGEKGGRLLIWNGTAEADFGFIQAMFGPNTNASVVAQVVRAQPFSGCLQENSAFKNVAELSRNFALVERGVCAFSDKVRAPSTRGVRTLHVCMCVCVCVCVCCSCAHVQSNNVSPCQVRNLQKLGVKAVIVVNSEDRIMPMPAAPPFDDIVTPAVMVAPSFLASPLMKRPRGQKPGDKPPPPMVVGRFVRHDDTEDQG